MWGIWNTLNTILIAVGLVACGTAPPAELTVGTIVSTPSAGTPKPDTVTPNPGSSAAPNNNTVSVTYYSLSKTVAPVSGWPLKTYTATGHCTVYLSKTYCWDDDIRVLGPWTSAGFTYGPYYYTYWSLGLDTLNRLTICGGSAPQNGGCASDVMEAPRTIAGSIQSNITTQSINSVLAGAATQVNCTDTNGVLDCGTFQIDTTQAVF